MTKTQFKRAVKENYLYSECLWPTKYENYPYYLIWLKDKTIKARWVKGLKAARSARNKLRNQGYTSYITISGFYE